MGGWFLALSASAFWVGILLEGLGRRGPGAPVALGAMVLGLGGLAALAYARHLHRRWPVLLLILWLSFALLGMGWAALHEAAASGSPLARLAGHSVRIQGSLSSDPKSEPLGWSASVSAGLLEPSAAGWPAELRVRGEVWVEGRGEAPHIQSGDRVELTGVLAPLHDRFGNYLRHRGYSSTFRIGEITLLGPPVNPLLRAADAARSAFRRSVEQALPSREGGLVQGLVLGDTSRLDAGTEEDFRATGLSHLTAVSGENVAMFLAPILGVATWIGLGRRARFAIGILATLFFVLLTRAEPSVLRAAMMASLTMLGIFLGRPRSPPAIMGGAILLLLAINPTLVYAIGFQLSVAATAGMALLSGPLVERLGWMPRGLGLAAATTLGAQAGVTPLLLYHFGIVPTVSVPANLLAFPAVGPGMLLGLASAATGLTFRPAGLFLAAVARLPLGYLEGLAFRLARSPLPSITSGGGNIVALLLELAFIAELAWLLRRRPRLPRKAIVALGLALPVWMWSGALRAGPPASLSITFFSVGWGDSALVRSPQGANILIDGGPDSEQVAIKLAGLGIRRIDLMVATHPHADHVTGLPAVLSRFVVGLVIDPGCRAPSPFYSQFLDSVQRSGVPFRHPRAGDRFQVGDVHVDVLGPEHCFHGTRSDPNNDSLVLRLTEGAHSVLFGGDAEQPNQTELLQDESDMLSAPVIKWPHHGGNTNLEEFYQAIRPGVAVISTGPNLYGDPSPIVLAKLSQYGFKVYRTDFAGDVTVVFRQGGVLIQSKHT